MVKHHQWGSFCHSHVLRRHPLPVGFFEVQTEENNGIDAGQDDGVRSADEPEAIITSKGKPLKRPVIIVDTDLRRSPRIKGHKAGFKNPQCIDKNCLGCGAAPPALNPKVIRKLGSSL
jgi:hypothetical protein